jgi:hypothetical protein
MFVLQGKIVLDRLLRAAKIEDKLEIPSWAAIEVACHTEDEKGYPLGKYRFWIPEAEFEERFPDMISSKFKAWMNAMYEEVDYAEFQLEDWKIYLFPYACHF